MRRRVRLRFLLLRECDKSMSLQMQVGEVDLWNKFETKVLEEAQVDLECWWKKVLRERV